MRKVVFAINVTVDGCCDHDMFNPDDEVLEYFANLLRGAGVLLYGRKTYELMIPYWPEVAKNNSGGTAAEGEFAKAFASVPQVIVFSKMLMRAEGRNTTIIRGHLQDEIRKLKQGEGGDIATGGVSFPSELLELGLIDEIHLIVHPIVARKGRRLFDGANLGEKLQLRLSQSRVFNSGCVALQYIKQ